MPLSKISRALKQYKAALGMLSAEGESPTLAKSLAVLHIRDEVQRLIVGDGLRSSQEIIPLMELDEKLRGQTMQICRVMDLQKWRLSLLPPNANWWWFLDNVPDDKSKQTGLLLDIITGTILIFITPLLLDIIQRFWENTSDTISMFGTLITVFITASPFLKQGQAVATWLLKKLPNADPRNLSKVRVTAASIAFIILLVLRLWFMPGPLAALYNNYGASARNAGNFDLANRMFQRAVALNPDRVVPYQNLGDAYKDIGFDEEAIHWYKKAIEKDVNFVSAYRGLGEVYNRMENYSLAESVLLTGLNVNVKHTDHVLGRVTEYELLANLGWSYWGQNKMNFAQETFETAIAMEGELQEIGDANGAEYRLALPHYYLAQIYENASETSKAIEQWEESLRFLDQSNWWQRERYIIALDHLQKLIK